MKSGGCLISTSRGGCRLPWETSTIRIPACPGVLRFTYFPGIPANLHELPHSDLLLDLHLCSPHLLRSFAHNQLTGPLPPEWGDVITKLDHLDLSNNMLTGTIPPEWSQDSLNVLVVSSARSKRWLTLNLASNRQRLGLSLPSCSAQAPGLAHELSMKHASAGCRGGSGKSGSHRAQCRQSSVSPPWCICHPMLVQLDDTENSVSDVAGLTLDNNQFSGTLPAAWSLMHRDLERFSARNNSLVGSLPSEYSVFSALRHL